MHDKHMRIKTYSDRVLCLIRVVKGILGLRAFESKINKYSISDARKLYMRNILCMVRTKFGALNYFRFRCMHLNLYRTADLLISLKVLIVLTKEYIK